MADTDTSKATRGRPQIGARVSVEVKQLIDSTCVARGCSMSDLIEGAVRAFVHPTDPGAVLVRLQQQVTSMQAAIDEMQQTVQQVGLVLTALVEQMAADAAGEEEEPAELVPVATYETLYGKPETWVDEPLQLEPLPAPKRSWWHRVVYKEVNE